MERRHLAKGHPIGRRLAFEQLELRVPPSDGVLGLLASAAWFRWGKELYAAGVTINDFQVAFSQVKTDAQAEDPSLYWLDDFDLWTIPMSENVLYYDPLEVDFDDWIDERVKQRADMLGLDLNLEPESAAERLMALLDQAVELAIANGGSLATVSPEGLSTEEGVVVDDSVDSSSSSCPTCPPMPNQPPVAGDDYFSLVHDTFLSGNVFNGDSIPPDGPQPPVWIQTASPTHGSLNFQSNGWFSYTPNPLYVGSDLFKYKIYDGADYSNEATVFLDVTNQAPTANDDPGGAEPFYRARWNTLFFVPDGPQDVLVNDTDPDGSQDKLNLQAIQISNTSHGNTVLQPNGSFEYTPDIGFTGDDSFTYKATDGIAASALAATVTIRVIGINLEISDGQGGAVVPEEPAPRNEWDRGAMTVANLNDTDGDGFVDSNDLEVHPYSTTLTSHIYPTQNVLEVATTAGFLPGHRVRIVNDPSDGLAFEDVWIASVDTAIQITLQNPVEQHSAPGSTFYHNGRDEVDLMKVKLNEPSWIDPNGPQYVMFFQVPGFAYWQKATKEIPYTKFGNIPLTDFSSGAIELYVELPAPSGSLRDRVLSLEYPVSLGMGPTGVWDVVKATGIWSVVNWDFATKSGSQVFGTQADPKPFDDMEDPPRNQPATYGLGEIPIGPDGVREGIAIQFHIIPERDIPTQGTWESDNVMFDLTRKIEYRLWHMDWAGVWTSQPSDLSLNQSPNWPLLEEEANDFHPGDPNVTPPIPTDPHPNNLESNNVTPKAYPPPATGPGNNMYSVDYPGRNSVATVPALIARYNFSEFMRVKFDGNRPQGAISGSRVSAFFDWHVTIWVSSNVVQGGTGTWTRNATGNAIGQGHLQNVNDRTGT